MHARVAQVIQAAGITFQIRLHADLGEIRSPDDFAKALGYDLRRISKNAPPASKRRRSLLPRGRSHQGQNRSEEGRRAVRCPSSPDGEQRRTAEPTRLPAQLASAPSGLKGFPSTWWQLS